MLVKLLQHVLKCLEKIEKNRELCSYLASRQPLFKWGIEFAGTEATRVVLD